MDIRTCHKPPVVFLTEQGCRRVLSGQAGMMFAVERFGGVDDRCAMVRDYRYQNAPFPYQTWTLGVGDFTFGGSTVAQLAVRAE